MNPALVALLDDDSKDYDCANGLDINQDNFEEQARELGYNTYFKIQDGEIYLSNIGDN